MEAPAQRLQCVHHFKAITIGTKSSVRPVVTLTWFLLWKAWRAVVLSINIMRVFTKEINFSSKVYSRSLLKGSPLSCTSLEEVISSPQYGYGYLIKDWCYLFILFCSANMHNYLFHYHGCSAYRQNN